ncbi:MAG: MoaD/ThiS family protein [Tsuneonella sp.]
MKLLFLGKLRDIAGTAEQELATDRSLDWVGVLAALEPALSAALSDPAVRVARNGELLADRERLSAQSDDELAFLPPVSGG